MNLEMSIITLSTYNIQCSTPPVKLFCHSYSHKAYYPLYFQFHVKLAVNKHLDRWLLCRGLWWWNLILSRTFHGNIIIVRNICACVKSSNAIRSVFLRVHCSEAEFLRNVTWLVGKNWSGTAVIENRNKNWWIIGLWEAEAEGWQAWKWEAWHGNAVLCWTENLLFIVL